jgi:hypothetical protein
MGQKGGAPPPGPRCWILVCSSPKGSAGYLPYPADMRDTAKSGMGCTDNRCLNSLVEFLAVNVGGWRAEASSPPLKHASVAGAIVVGGWESQLPGEGRQRATVLPVGTRASLRKFRRFAPTRRTPKGLTANRPLLRTRQGALPLPYSELPFWFVSYRKADLTRTMERITEMDRERYVTLDNTFGLGI